MNKIDKTFIIHYEPLIDRKKYLENQINNRIGFENYEFILSNVDTDKKILEKNNYIYVSNLFNKLTNPEICNYEVQVNVWKKIVENKYKNTLIVEDDIIFKENYNQYIKEVLDNLPKDYDICFLSECCNLYPLNPDKKLFVESNTSRCCVAYIISENACKKLIEVKNFHFPIDHHLNFVKKSLELKYYWLDPTIFNQGSVINYKSNADRNR